jgi:hypothetical protein
MRRLIVFALVTLSCAASVSAGPSCGRWISQTNGTEWRMCTDAQGNQYCELRRRNVITRITCP